MKLAKRFAALVMGATLALGSVAGLAACGEGDTQENVEESIHAIYDLYTAHCAENNVTPQTYEQWLASIKGDPGEDGITPEIGEDGYWYFYGVKTNYKAVAEDGKSAYEQYVEKYKNEHDGSDEGVLDEDAWVESLYGEKGQTGDRGSRWFYYAGAPTTAPSSTTSGVFNGLMVNDYCLDTTTWDVWVFERNGGSVKWRNLGSIKGADGKDGVGGSGGDSGEGGGTSAQTNYEYNINLANGASTQVSVKGLTPGPHVVTLDTGNTKKSYAGNQNDSISPKEWRMQVGTASYHSLFVHSSSRTTKAGSGHNIAYTYIVVHAGDEMATVTAYGEAIPNAKLVIEKETWTLNLSEWLTGKGGSLEIPVNGLNMPEADIIRFAYPSTNDLIRGTTWTGIFAESSGTIQFNLGSNARPQTIVQCYVGEGIAVPNFVGGVCGTPANSNQGAGANFQAFQLKSLDMNLGGQLGYLMQTAEQPTGHGFASASAIWPLRVTFSRVK